MLIRDWRRGLILSNLGGCTCNMDTLLGFLSRCERSRRLLILLLKRCCCRARRSYTLRVGFCRGRKWTRRHCRVRGIKADNKVDLFVRLEGEEGRAIDQYSGAVIAATTVDIEVLIRRRCIPSCEKRLHPRLGMMLVPMVKLVPHGNTVNPRIFEGVVAMDSTCCF